MTARDGRTTREAIIWALSAGDVPPLGWSVPQIAGHSGRPAPEIRAELAAMESDHLVRYTRTGRKITWFLLDPASHFIPPARQPGELA